VTGPSAVFTTGPVLLLAVMGAQPVAANRRPTKIDVVVTRVLTAVPPLLLQNKKGTQEAQEAQEDSLHHFLYLNGGRDLGLRKETLDLLAAPAIPPTRGFHDECLKGDVIVINPIGNGLMRKSNFIDKVIAGYANNGLGHFMGLRKGRRSVHNMAQSSYQEAET
jgi:hypothetical protein